MAVVDVESVWKRESAVIIGALVRMVRDLSIAEELAQDALVAALETWPSAGVPDNPGAWLMTTAKRRAIDRLRRDRVADVKHAEIGRDLETRREEALTELESRIDDGGLIEDDLLRLVFVSCHPVLSTEARVA